VGLDNLVLMVTLEAKDVVDYLDGKPRQFFRSVNKAPCGCRGRFLQKQRRGHHWVSSPDGGYPYVAHDSLSPTL
jgi:hypothetical protein